MFYEHPLDDHSGLLWRRLQSEPRLHVIHLTRDDLLRTVVSRKIAHQDGVWTDTQIARRRMPSPTRVSLTAEEAVEGFEKIRRWEERWPLMFAGKPILRVTYEELARRPRATMHRVFGFLGQSYVPPRTPLNRLNPRALSEMILNYQSLKMALADSTWTSFFDE